MRVAIYILLARFLQFDTKYFVTFLMDNRDREVKV